MMNIDKLDEMVTIDQNLLYELVHDLGCLYDRRREKADKEKAKRLSYLGKCYKSYVNSVWCLYYKVVNVQNYNSDMITLLVLNPVVNVSEPDLNVNLYCDLCSMEELETYEPISATEFAEHVREYVNFILEMSVLFNIEEDEEDGL